MDGYRTLQSFLLVMASLFASLFTCAVSYPSSAKLSTNWTNVEWDVGSNTTQRYGLDGIFIVTLLKRRIREGGSPRLRTAYGCGFYCKTEQPRGCPSYLFAVFIVLVDPSLNDAIIPDFGPPEIVWSANRNLPVGINATLDFAADGNLLLKDADGTLVWSTNTSGKSVARMELTNEGNLVLFDKNKRRVWQSFDHPTDTLLPGQKLKVGQKLTPSVSLTNYTERGVLSLSMTRKGLIGVMETVPPQVYSEVVFDGFEANKSEHALYTKFTKSAFFLATNYEEYSVGPDYHHDTYTQYLKLSSDGHLSHYEWYVGDYTSIGEWILDADLLTSEYLDSGNCSYPIVCGDYGICSNNGQCSCPNDGIVYFRQIDFKKPNLGCSLITPLSCGESQYQSFVERKDIYYFTFNYRYFSPDLNGVDSEKCKEACANNCSCKAAIFQYQESTSNGSCYLPSQVFSFMINDVEITGSNFTTYFKVQNVSTVVTNGDKKGAPSSSLAPNSSPKKNHVLFIAGSSFAAFVALFLFIGFLVWRKKHALKAEENYLDEVPGMPTRFSYKDLKAASENFSKKLGEGGFGSVFRGVLHDGSKIAVKHLGGLSHIQNNSFLAEVKTIGGIHHVNLVRLVGFCAEKSHRLLVYEYMANGSLDKWIFRKSEQSLLTWQQRKKIILDIAKGLNYLHEECRQKIIHLDIKPQNILIDENFNAKVSDFGLSKLIDRNQSHVTTTMKGTIGYLAPECLGAKISEKVDIYSFGVVILEIVCGRKVIDTSLDEEDMYLLNLCKRKAEEDKLVDMVDKHSEDMQLHDTEAVSMMRIAAWCLQSDLSERPSMSMVIKVFDRAMDLPDNLEYNFSNPSCTKATTKACHKDGLLGATTRLSPCILSGPR